jgi:hypothetical protein
MCWRQTRVQKHSKAPVLFVKLRLQQGKMDWKERRLKRGRFRRPSGCTKEEMAAEHEWRRTRPRERPWRLSFNETPVG